MKKFIILAALLTLAACATPREQCISGARAEQSAIVARIQIAEGNIARGFAIHHQRVPYTYAGICYDGVGGSYSCPRTGVRTSETPVAIDVAEERRKLAGLKRQLPAATARADAAAAQCRMTHPE